MAKLDKSIRNSFFILTGIFMAEDTLFSSSKENV